MTYIITENGPEGSAQREASPDEVAQIEADIAEAQRLAAQRAAAEAARVQAVQDAQAELKGLGLSDAAVATISGYPYPYSPAV